MATSYLYPYFFGCKDLVVEFRSQAPIIPAIVGISTHVREWRGICVNNLGRLSLTASEICQGTVSRGCVFI